MAEHVDTADGLAGEDLDEDATELERGDDAAAPDTLSDADESVKDANAETSKSPRLAGLAVSLVVLIVIPLAALAGWQSFQWYHQQEQQTADAEMLEAAREGAVALTSIDAANIDADVKRILDSSMGTFHDDFAGKAGPFVDIVKQAQSKTEGTVTAAGIESLDGDQAKVLVTVTVKTSNAGEPEQEPRSWRMRISVNRAEAGVKMSDVQFVP